MQCLTLLHWYSCAFSLLFPLQAKHTSTDTTAHPEYLAYDTEMVITVILSYILVFYYCSPNYLKSVNCTLVECHLLISLIVLLLQLGP